MTYRAYGYHPVYEKWIELYGTNAQALMAYLKQIGCQGIGLQALTGKEQ